MKQYVEGFLCGALYGVLVSGVITIFVSMGLSNAAWREYIVDNPEYIDAVRTEVEAERATRRALRIPLEEK